LFVATLAMLIICLMIFILGIIGFGLLLSLFKIAAYASIAKIVLRAIAGVGLLAGSVGCGVLLLFALNGAVKMLGNYARLHYRLLRPQQDAA
jgi:hypothetical protein